MSGRRLARALAALALVAGPVVGSAAPAHAGGTWLYPVLDRYEIGDEVTLVGYVGRGTLGWLDDGPFYGYLHRAGGGLDVPYVGVPLGRLTVEPTGATDWTALRVSLTLPLDDDLEPGQYAVAYCNDPCTSGLGDLLGSRPFAVGVAPVERLVHEWPLDEPEIANLDATALVSGPGYVATAAEVLARRVTPGPIPPAPPAASLPAVVPPPVSVAAAAQPQPAPPPAPPTTVVPVTTVAQPPASVASPVASPVAAPTPVPPVAPGDGNSPALVLLGVVLAAGGTGAVLHALREGGPGGTSGPDEPAPAYATRRRWYMPSSSTSSPTTHSARPSVSSS